MSTYFRQILNKVLSFKVQVNHFMIKYFIKNFSITSFLIHFFNKCAVLINRCIQKLI